MKFVATIILLTALIHPLHGSKVDDDLLTIWTEDSAPNSLILTANDETD